MQIVSQQNLIKLSLSKKEFDVLKFSIVIIWQEYHFPNPPTKSFENKFGYSFEENDCLYKEFTDLDFQKNAIVYVDFNHHRQSVFVTVLKEIVNNYEYYEFQTITGFYKHEVQKVLHDLQEILIKK
ncbi:MAG: hypothetical protein KKH06_00130 [Gammaproteobacteria bacterium]|nr:hypothetical protein [Gammaproteobacteria bacterium]MBU1628484.1 hypothetical protein [Gammaproteobacteria bacterium]